ncbi:hypothetical protein [Arthrobacter sp. PsM3]|uniref:hypothetical protein n=1 Tax=Arthrobacter sp. PsM3 TaxID=3030531 RepID=UPI00263B127D|nr:hypothetical protein [Arthrobacter sp. PsM3]MDN4645382.1 hypothetical protein [Arthrobacter sp. PsM3]
MTEQPAEPTTEQAWLGNPRPIAYLHNGHRIPARPAAEMAPKDRTGLAAKFLGAIDSAFDKADHDLTGRRATDAGLNRIHQDIEAGATKPQTIDPQTKLLLEAEFQANEAVTALSSGELDLGIAYLQSALAFAQNHRHATRHEGTDQ